EDVAVLTGFDEGVPGDDGPEESLSLQTNVAEHPRPEPQLLVLDEDADPGGAGARVEGRLDDRHLALRPNAVLGAEARVSARPHPAEILGEEIGVDPDLREVGDPVEQGLRGDP